MMEIRRIPLSQLNPACYNPRRDLQPGDPDYDSLKKSLLAFDLVEPLVWNERTGNLVGGHQRLKVLQELGYKEVEVSVVDLPAAKEKALNLALNRIQGGWDWPKLADLFSEINTDGFDISVTGFDEKALEIIMASFGEQPNYRDLTDTSRQGADTAENNWGYNGSSVWGMKGDEETRAAPYYLKLPLNPDHAGDKTPGKEHPLQRYSRSPFKEMENIVRTYLRPRDRFLEVCAGWWTFSTMAAMWGYEGVGQDIWDISIAFGKEQLAALPGGVGSRIKQVQGDARSLPFAEGEFDYVYCNPPWYNWGKVERYSKSPDDLTTMSWEEWKKAALQILREMFRVVKAGGLVTTVIADYRRNGIQVPFHCDWLNLGKEAGFEFWDFVIQELRTQGFILWRRAWDKRRTIKAHEYVITFRKPGAASLLLPQSLESELQEELYG